ncbi:hypothetical protein [Paenibacillus sp. RC67]|uniref:hypothetical protein n=1 Tax=Paenibacillus sp. RC67 TaxID=3039392 RepID=UPI0024AD7978|nr:hypothetical protein [Paenibacillus sp. RC67]
MKMIIFFALLLLYPLFLHWIKISDYRVVPLVVPYALGVLSITIILSGITEFIVKKIKQ